MLRLDFNKWFKHEASRCQHPAGCAVPCTEKYNSPQVPFQALLAAIRESLSAMWFQEKQDTVFVIRFTALFFNLLQVFLCLLNTKCLIRSSTIDLLLFLRITGGNGDKYLETGMSPRTEQLGQESRCCHPLAEWPPWASILTPQTGIPTSKVQCGWNTTLSCNQAGIGRVRSWVRVEISHRFPTSA